MKRYLPQLYCTPRKWLAWIAQRKKEGDCIELARKTRKLIAPLSQSEIQIALAVMENKQQGRHVCSATDIRQQCESSVESSQINALFAKGYIRKEEPPKGHTKETHNQYLFWSLEPSRIADVERIEQDLQALIDKFTARITAQMEKEVAA